MSFARRCATMVAGVIGFGACAAPPPPAPPPPTQRYLASRPSPIQADARARATASSDRVGALFGSAFEDGGWPGLAVGMVTREGLVAARNFGVRNLESKAKVDSDTIFRIGSITKTLTGLAVLKLRDEGRLTLDDPADFYLPELLGVLYPTRDSPRITLRHLITHTSGLSRDGALPRLREGGHAPTDGEVLASLDNQALDGVPGTAPVYSNQAAALTGLLVARISGLPYPDYVGRNLLAPLGMVRSGFEPTAAWGENVATGYVKKDGSLHEEPTTPRSATAAAGQLFTSINDLARFVAFELSAWPPRDDPELGPVRRSTVRESQLVAGEEEAGKGRGVFWRVQRLCELPHVVFHDGTIDGFHAAVAFAPREGVGVIALANVREPEGFDDLVLRALVLAVRPDTAATTPATSAPQPALSAPTPDAGAPLEPRCTP